MIRPFTLSTTPVLQFGNGKINALPEIASGFGKNILLITGSRSFTDSQHYSMLMDRLATCNIIETRIVHEPSPEAVDQVTLSHSPEKIDVVIAIGGGSVLDAGKAISAMLPVRQPVMEYLEGVGVRGHDGNKIPFIAVPTTAGTGSEATKNAVLSRVGHGGFKRSLRHENFVPNIALVDPGLTLTCPQGVTAASGMDAFTQLLESYLSVDCNPYTDALALEGLARIARSLMKAYNDPEDLDARGDMSMAAYLSGITLANAGLGLVHGFASPIGAKVNIPHGVVCSALMAPVNELTVRRLRADKTNHLALERYARAGTIFHGTTDRSGAYYADALLDTISMYTAELHIPRLSEYGVELSHVETILSDTDQKKHPVKLTKDELTEALVKAL